MTSRVPLRQLPTALMALLLSCAVFGCAGGEDDSRPEAQRGHTVPLEKDEIDPETTKDGEADPAKDDDATPESEADGPMPDLQPPACSESDQRECTVELVQASGVHSCWKGVQFCVDGAWSECYEAADPSAPL